MFGGRLSALEILENRQHPVAFLLHFNVSVSWTVLGTWEVLNKWSLTPGNDSRSPECTEGNHAHLVNINCYVHG